MVLPVGGIKEKVVAAAAAGLSRVMLPARNRRDYEEIPRSARAAVEFVWLENVEQAISAVLDEHEARHSPVT
jgi:ATP-dependent Lon protease